MKAVGVRGELKFRAMTDFPRALIEKKALLFLDARTGEVAEARPTRIHSGEGAFAAAFAGIATREDAERLVGAYLGFSSRRAVPLPEGEYYPFQLEGLRVVDGDGVEFGVVKTLDPGIAWDFLIVECADGGEKVVPMIEKYIKEISVADGTIVVDSQNLGWKI